MNKITIGLDLGTDKCCMTYQDNIGRPFIIIDEDSYKISSIIGIMNNGLLIGNDISKDNMYDIPIISNLKRLIGNKSTSNAAQIIAKYNNWVLMDDLENNDLIININDKSYSLNYLMCNLLNKLKQIIIANIGEDFDVIITIPANFNEGQKNCILSYCNQVNIHCRYLVYEPCSAALTYINYFKNNLDEEELQRIIVFDFGAGTLDLAIVSCNCIKEENNIEWMAKIESNIGDNNLGGIDIDIILGNYILEKYPEINCIQKQNNFLIESIKIKLSKLDINSKSSIVEKYYNQIITINQSDYYRLLDDNFKDRIVKLLDQIHQYDITKSDIDNIILIGGSCYNPWIKKLIEEYYQKEISTYKLNVNNRNQTINLDIKDIGVSLGATCYGRKINKDGSNLILTESLPLSIGVETINNIMCKIIPKNTLIPCTVKEYFSTSEDYQKEIEIKLYQGEREDTRENFYLGSFKIDNLEPELQGKIVLIINISITTDGLIIIEGKIKNTDKFNKRIIINRHNYSIDNKLIEQNIKQYEVYDTTSNNIMIKYYELITMLNKLQYNLLDNIVSKLSREKIDEILLSFWDELIIIYKLMLDSDKLKQNINQLTKFIEYIKQNLDYKYNLNMIANTDDKIIVNKLDKLNKYINNNFQHMVSTYQIKIDIDKTKYDVLDKDIILNDINSIEIIDNTALEKEIKDLLLMIAENIQTFYMPDNNKILLLDFIDKYDVYINEKSKKNNINGELEKIQKVCQIISDIADDNYIDYLQTKLNISIELVISEILNIK
jgi:molecular chaperone DnaK (HSP70)